MRIAVYYSSRTGNTEKLVTHVAKLLEKEHAVSLFKTMDTNNGEETAEADLYVIGFWCRKSGMDDLSLKLLESFSGKRILALGTMAGDALGDYGGRVKGNARSAIETRNTCIGVFVCRGAVDLERKRKLLLLPEDDPKHITQEKYERYLLTQGHPDEEDLKRVAEFVKEKLSEFS